MIEALHRHRYCIAGGIAFLVLFPLFVQIQNGIFRDRSMIFDPQGLVSRVPLPISLVACLAGILLIGRVRQALPIIGVVCSSFLLMVIASFIAAGGIPPGRQILLLQFVLPMSGLVLGGLYDTIDEKMHVLARVFLAILWFIVPAQLVCSWIQGGSSSLWPGLYLFSIYQHLQYVPVTFACAFVLVLFAAGYDQGIRKWILLFLPIMAFYLIVASSIAGISLLIGGAGLWTYLYGRNLITRRFLWFPGIVILGMVLIFGYMCNFRDYNMVKEKLGFHQQNSSGYVSAPLIEKRLKYWSTYGKAITQDMRSFLAGNTSARDGNNYPGAHNYYLDFIFHLGLLPFLPLLVLIVMTIRRVGQERRAVFDAPDTAGLTVVVLFILIIESMVKVGLRQPYPGIFAFFLWGILLSRLSVFPTGSRREGLPADSRGH